MTATEVLATAAAAVLLVALFMYLGTWLIIGHEPLLRRNCECGKRNPDMRSDLR